MLINGIELSTFGVKLYDRVLTSNAVNTRNTWLDGDIQPTFIRQQDGFKTMELQFLVLATDEDEAFMRMSKLTQALKKATIKFDDIDLTFDVTLTGSAKQERLKNGNFIVSYQFKSDYAKGNREIYTTDATATNSFKLTVLYYQDRNTLLATDSVTIRAASFIDEATTLNEIGVNVNKYQPNYYSGGVVTNLTGTLSYETLYNLQTLIINYSPTQYHVSVEYFNNDGTGHYTPAVTEDLVITYPQVQAASTIGQIIKVGSFKPEGFKANIQYNGELTLEALLAASPIYVFFDSVDTPLSKDIAIIYEQEVREGVYETVHSSLIHVNETDVYDGRTLSDLIAVNAYRPNITYYSPGAILNHDPADLITFKDLEVTYTVRYALAENTVFVEYYAGTYPNWYRLTTLPVSTKYSPDYEENFSLAAVGIDVDKYRTSSYNEGQIYSGDVDTYEELLTTGVVRIYYTPVLYRIIVRYYKDSTTSEAIAEDEIMISELTFFSNPILSDIVPITSHRPEGWQLDTKLSYSGEVSLSALTQASPISIVYKEIEQTRMINVIVRYRQELASAYSVINTILLTLDEANYVEGVRLKDVINLNLYKPDYYENGVLDGASSTALIPFDQVAASYDVVYSASTYNLPVRYFKDTVSDGNWLGSSNISFRVIDFTTTTTLYDLGLNLNAYKPSYANDGVVTYTGPVNFSSLVGLDAINVTYETLVEPEDPSGIDYPHRFLFLQHNDLGDYESEHPGWSFTHSYINTGVTVDDMSKLTVVMETRVYDKDTPMYEVNAGKAYLFGSKTYGGTNALDTEFYMRYNNQTKYGTGLSGVNLYEAKAGTDTAQLSLTEESAVGFSSNSGITASDRAGYSYATFTYTNNLQSDNSKMLYPLYLFANNAGGHYEGGIANVGIYSCRIYYENQLLRDFIPVQYYDKIGDQVSPANCLYDKVSQTFFLDASGNNGFNVIDDERYTDTNLEHKIGQCYVYYYHGDTLHDTKTVWFRASDFVDGTWDLYEQLDVDGMQPLYYKAGVIEGMDGVAINFDNLNGRIIRVRYEEEENHITVNYYQQSDPKDEETRTLLKSEDIVINEKTFYQAPMFGDIVRLNKYRPEGYKTDFVYTGKRVSLPRVLESSPYTIVYIPETDSRTYSTTVRYMKDVFGIRTYETIATDTLTLPISCFREGEYIDYYIDLNAHKPTKYYEDGERYGWYSLDERITTPDMLKDEYVIRYRTSTMPIEIRYYVDSVEEENLIATTVWTTKLDDYDPSIDDGLFQLIDEIPNSYVNKFKPGYCSGGQWEDPSHWWSFEELVDTGYINIIYPRLAEPHDPESAAYEQKILFFGALDSRMYLKQDQNYPLTAAKLSSAPAPGSSRYDNAPQYEKDMLDSFLAYRSPTYFVGGRIPWVDLGYTAKETGRLRVEIKCQAQSIEGFSPGDSFNDGLYFFGYYSPIYSRIRKNSEGLYYNWPSSYSEEWYSYKQDVSPSGAGCFAIRCHAPIYSGWIYTTNGPTSVDGYRFWTAAMSEVNNEEPETMMRRDTEAMYAVYRKGYYTGTDLDWNEYVMNHNYVISSGYSTIGRNGNGYFGGAPHGVWRKPNSAPVYTDPTYYNNGEDWGAFAEPWYITLDAWNGYGEIYTDYNSNTPKTVTFDDSGDDPAFEGRPEVKGSLSLFQTTNPMTGEVNVLPFPMYTHHMMSTSGGYPAWVFNRTAGADAYQDAEIDGTYTYTEWVVTNVGATTSTGEETSDDKHILAERTFSKNIKYFSFNVPMFPQLSGAAVWSIKIWDRDRLVRDLIPVAKGDQIYNYTMPGIGLFDLVTEIFFGNSNEGGHYEGLYTTAGSGVNLGLAHGEVTIPPEEVMPLMVMKDPSTYGKAVVNYYDYDNNFIDNQYVDVPTWFGTYNTTIENELRFNDFKPDDFHLDGMVDIDRDPTFQGLSLKQIWEMGAVNIYYKLRTFTKTVVYYQDNVRIGSKDIYVSLTDIQNATKITDLGVNVDLYYDPKFKHGRVVFDNSILESDDLAAFIDAPSPIVVYDKLTKQEAPNLLYLEWYRGGAYDDDRISWDPADPNYLDCDLTAVVLNPAGSIKYLNHYHTALYEDEVVDYFRPYQVRVINHYTGIHKGPGKKYDTLATIVVRDTYTIVQERNGWGRLKEYSKGWIQLSATVPMSGPGQNPEYDVPGAETATIPFSTRIHLSRLTIDRLWAYADKYESWVKTEEISYDQSGKLYNGIAIKVIDLNTIDWSNVSSLKDMGIDPDAYRMYYHDSANFTYSGDYTYEAFSDLHDIEFVNPETIYNINCIYYQDRLNKNNELGRVAASFSLSDWNPDWDVVVETGLPHEIHNYGKATTAGTHYYQASSNRTFLYTLGGTFIKDFPYNIEVSITGEKIVEGVNNYYPVEFTYLNTEYSGKISSTELHIITNYSVTWGITPPTLYRSYDPVLLDFGFFGFEKNLYKPAGGYDGIYIWNAHSWDLDNPKFGFAEFIGAAQQKVLYPAVEPEQFKSYWKPYNSYITSVYYGSVGYRDVRFHVLPGYIRNQRFGSVANADFEYAVEPYYSTEWLSSSPASDLGIVVNSTSTENGGSSHGVLSPFAPMTRPGQSSWHYGDYYIHNSSKSRSNYNNVMGIKNFDNRAYEDKFYYTTKGTNSFNYDGTFRWYNSSWWNSYYNQYVFDIPEILNLSGGVVATDAAYIPDYISGGCWHYFRIWSSYSLVRYWTPVPKGMRYVFNGEQRRFESSGFFDVITGDFIAGPDVMEIYLYNKDYWLDTPYDYFSTQTFNYTDYNAIVSLGSTRNSYTYPDTLANLSSSQAKEYQLLSGLVVPVSRVTSDTENGISGEWYYSSGKWFDSSNTSSYTTNGFNSTKLAEQSGKFIFTTTPRVYLDPLYQTASSITYEQGSNKTTGSLDDYTHKFYYEYYDGIHEATYFIGNGWVKRNDTSGAQVTGRVKNYTIAVNTKDCYSYPIAVPDAKVKTYIYGDRISILYLSTDMNWGYTGEGWITTSDLNEIV